MTLTLEEALEHHRHGRAADAERAYRTILETDPQQFEANYYLSQLLASQGAIAQAAALAEAAARARPDSERAAELAATLHHALGTAARKKDRLQEALAHFGRALELNPKLVEAHAGIGDVQLELGDVPRGKRSFETAAGLAPERIALRARIIGVERVRPGNAHLEALEAARRDDASLRTPERIQLHFALGKAYRDVGDEERAFDEFVAGNALKRTTLEYDERRAIESMAAMAALFTGDFLDARKDWGDPSELPVFIVGMPRSGSTLIEQILASHPQVAAGGELPYFREAADGVNLLTADGPAMRGIARRYLTRLAALSPGATRAVDKMPSNFGHAGIIRIALARARIVHARRDPFDTCLSCFSTLFGEGHPFTYDLGELGRYYRAYERLMAHWRNVIPPRAMLEVRYEDVVENLEREARRLIAFVGLPWDDACLRFFETKRPVRTASLLQVREPIYRTSVGRWRPSKAALQPLYDALQS